MKKKVNIVKGMPSQKRDKILYDEDNEKTNRRPVEFKAKNCTFILIYSTG